MRQGGHLFPRGLFAAIASLAAVSFCFVSVPSARAALLDGSITGHVTDSASGQPIAGASISAGGSNATTDSSGSYTLSSVPMGSASVTASASGYASSTKTAQVMPILRTTVNFTLAANQSSPFSHYWLGANYAWWNYATDFGDGGWGKYTDWSSSIPGHFQTMAGQGVRVVRWWLFGDGRYAPDFNSNGTVSGLDASVLSDIDHALQIAAQNNIYILFTVMDGNMWGNASYSGSVQMGGHSAMITDATTQQSFLDNALKPVLQHVAGSPYAKYVIGYDLVNEPESQMSGSAGYWGGVNLDPAQVQSFVQKCATYVHSYGGRAYATVGSATPYYVATWKNLGLDFYQIHYYPWMDFSNPAGSGLPTCASLGLDKPCIVGEFPTNDASYGLTDTNALSARWYLDTIYNNGYAGALAWSFFTGDDASNWSSFQPVFTDWSNSHSALVGP